MKKRICKLLALSLMLTAVILLASCNLLAPQATTAAGIKVLLVFPEGSATADTTLVTVAPGETASFALTIAEGYEYIGNDCEATYENGYLTLSDVRYPTTITVDIRISDDNVGETPVINFDALDWSFAAKDGTVNSTVAAGTYPKNTPITVTATAKEGYTFLGWSEDAYLVEQGKLVSESTSYTFALAAPTELYANFKSDDEAIIRYHLNGGSAKGTKQDVYWQSFPLDYYLYPNTVADTGTFTRDGYSLLEYTEKQNGGGYVTNPGGKAFLESDGIIDLWLQWSKWSDASLFTTVAAKGGIAITGYTGSETIISIPHKINGQNVIAIKAGAFSGKAMETLIIPKTVITIDANAVANCASLKTVYMWDSITTVSNDSFKNSPFKTFCYNAATAPKFSSWWGSYSRKFERVISLYGKGNTLVVMAGSSTLYSLDSPYMEELLAKEGLSYNVCNLGIQASVSQLFCTELLSNFLDRGDMVIHAPEGSAVTNELSPILIEMMESFYNGFRYVDISNYKNLFANITVANAARAAIKTPSAYTDYRDNCSIHGDWLDEFKNVNEPGVNGGASAGKNAPTQINRFYAPLTAKGVKVYYSFAPLNGYNFKSTPEQCAALEAAIDANILAPRISTVLDYVFDPIYICNSNAHTNDKGADLRTERLARDILAQLAKENG